MNEPRQNDNKTPYVRDVIFESGYFDVQRPALLSHIAGAAGFSSPDPSGEYKYLELGCSIGTTSNGLAAANPKSKFFGIDFNDQHIAIASKTATACELENVEFFQADFAHHERLDLPQFDYITIHGTYSWLAPSTEAAIHAIVDKHLKKNGIFFVDYMSNTGKASIAPMWHLMREITEGYEGDSAHRAAEGFEFLRLLVQKNAAYFKENSHAVKVFNTWDKKLSLNPANARQLAHNALTEDWNPKYFSKVEETLSAIGLQFAGSSDLRMNDLDLALPAALREAGNSKMSRSQLEQIKEFYHHTQQRRDIFVRTNTDSQNDANSTRASKTHFAFLWPPLQKPNPKLWELKTPDSTPLNLDTQLLDNIVTGLSQGLTRAEEFKLMGYGTSQIEQTMGRMLLSSNLNVFSEAPDKLQKTELKKIRPTNTYNRMAVKKFFEGNRSLTLASSKYGGCINLPPLMSAIVAAFLDRKRCDLTVTEVLKIAGNVPGQYQIGQNNQLVEAKNLTEEMITPMYNRARRVIIPSLIRYGALKAI